MARFELVLTVFVVYLAAASASNVTHCFVCQSANDPSCVDPFDTINGKTADCSRLDFTKRGIVPDMIEDAVLQERTTPSNVTFVCIKISYTQNNTDGVMRSCFPTRSDIANTCNFVEEETNNSTLTITNCNYCINNNCNSGSPLQISAILLSVVLFLTSKA